VDEMQQVLPGVRQHHEWFDGSGYPDGLQKDENLYRQGLLLSLMLLMH
jgi:response regulator RpfG family c-di-GMP phosphodiesterase